MPHRRRATTALMDGDGNKLAPWFGIDAYNIGYAAGEWMADYATENDLTEDDAQRGRCCT